MFNLNKLLVVAIAIIGAVGCHGSSSPSDCAADDLEVTVQLSGPSQYCNVIDRTLMEVQVYINGGLVLTQDDARFVSTVHDRFVFELPTGITSGHPGSVLVAATSADGGAIASGEGTFTTNIDDCMKASVSALCANNNLDAGTAALDRGAVTVVAMCRKADFPSTVSINR
jgi:hypothetical protein